jgi:ATP-dependent protease ClpP protease subunit
MMTVDLKRMVALAEDLRAREVPPKESRARSWYRIEDRTSETAEVYIYEEIGMWGISSKDFVAELRGVKAKKIELHINSGGGSVFEGVAIYEALLDHPAHIVSIVDALAASAASFIAMAGEEIEIKKTARMMIHNASGGVLGTKKDMREHADLLDALDSMIAEIYADRAGGTIEEWAALMEAETWFNAQQAVDAKLANRIAGDIPPDPSDKLTIVDHTPPAPPAPPELVEDVAGTIDPEWLRNIMKEATAAWQ